ncbi:hypothetical protein [Ramlibacter albus]|uniref:Uncharacterized protein n=1 Tax=Ramlibacter albus TaxID=2079448 RepID=A0A923MB55_9BURK|nr:hypothetical protein [Ramlibacter albus]MBC5766996.1 hypothetical protein [Ramlibacter albus]
MALDGDVSAQHFTTPLGSAFTLLEVNRQDIARAVSQRAAERVALRNVRESLDGYENEEAMKRKLVQRYKWFIVGIVAAVLVTLFTVYRIAADRAQAARGGATFQLK